MGEGAELGLAWGPSGLAVWGLFQVIGPLCPTRSLGLVSEQGAVTDVSATGELWTFQRY